MTKCLDFFNFFQFDFLIDTNNLFYFYPISYNITNKIPETPSNNIIDIDRHFRKQKRNKYHYTFCDNDINKYLDKGFSSEFGFCDPEKIDERSSLLHTTHYTLKNVIANTRGSWSVGTTFISPPFEVYHDFKWPQFFELNYGSIVCEFDEVILTGHGMARHNFGHCLHDLISPIVLLPDDVRERSYVIGSGERPFLNELLILIGFRKKQIIELEQLDWFHAKIIHVFSDWRPLSNLAGDCIYKLNKEISWKLQLDQIQASNYAFYNRKNSKMRVISNFEDVYKAATKKFPNCKWIIVKDQIGSFEKSAKIMASLRLIVCTVGSNVFNGIFMKENTVLCIGSSEFFDFYSAYFLVASKHFVCWFPVPGMKHGDKQESKWDPEITLSAISNSIYCTQNGHFPSS